MRAGYAASLIGTARDDDLDKVKTLVNEIQKKFAGRRGNRGGHHDPKIPEEKRLPIDVDE